MLTTPADSAFSDRIRDRANWTCEICGTRYPPPNSGLQCAHYFSRGFWSTRFDPDNCLAACTHCHFRLHEDPDFHHDLMISRLGIDRYESLRSRAHDVQLAKKYKQTKGKGLIAKHFRECLLVYDVQ
jgi:hypothetical protein